MEGKRGGAAEAKEAKRRRSKELRRHFLQRCKQVKRERTRRLHSFIRAIDGSRARAAASEQLANMLQLRMQREMHGAGAAAA